ncbi:DUF58 domain-containing protein [Neokomagataea tanensis]|uniref:DUF58 domain-containing protein n=3 Tax=Acetobacteraceae TaxID=433 RepID=A0A4Y6VBK4_9PROT|nr:DUF58 domain-containing protein [Neokomagataea tanensis]
MPAPQNAEQNAPPSTGAHTAYSSPNTSLEPLILEALSYANSLDNGAHGRRRSGAGDNFWQFRPYHPGEPAFAIDWRQSARSPVENTFWVREREHDTPHSLAVWCDGSPSMQWASLNTLSTKNRRAQLCALTLAAAALKAGERIIPLASGHSNRSLAGHTALPQLAAALNDTTANASPPDLSGLPRGASALIISDFLWEQQDFKQWCKENAHFAGRLTLLCVLDPAERNLHERGRVRFEGLEGGTLTLPALESLAASYGDAMKAHLAALHEAATAINAQLIHHSTDQDPLPTLLDLHTALGGAR